MWDDFPSKSYVAQITMFRGSFEHTLDGKGRLSIPMKFREVLLGKSDERIVITNFVVDGMKCLDVYPLDEWSRLEEEIRKKPKFDRKMLMFQNYYLGGASECVVDKQGRILIPPLLRKYAELRARCRTCLSFGKVSRLGSRGMEENIL